MKKNSTYALMGLIGGALYEIADYWIYINSNLDKLNPDSSWAEMPALRFTASMIFAVIGSYFLYFGYLATRRMLERTGNVLEKVLGAAGVIGVVSTVCGHFLLGCIKPLIYKGMVLAGCEAQYLTVSDFVDRYSCIVSWLAIIGIYLPHLASVCCLLKGKTGISRWKLAEIAGIFIAVTAISAAVFAVLGITGSVGACESLLEGVLCLIPYWYWKNNESEDRCC